MSQEISPAIHMETREHLLGTGHGVGSSHMGSHLTLAQPLGKSASIIPNRQDCKKFCSGRGGILTWVRLILSFLFHAFSNHRLQGNSNYVCPTLLMYSLGDPNKMQRCFVNTDVLFRPIPRSAGPSVVPSGAAVCAASCPPLTTHLFPTLPLLYRTLTCTTTVAPPESAAPVALAMVVHPCPSPEQQQPCPNLAGKSWHVASRIGRVCGKSEEMFFFLGKKAKLHCAGVV